MTRRLFNNHHTQNLWHCVEADRDIAGLYQNIVLAVRSSDAIGENQEKKYQLETIRILWGQYSVSRKRLKKTICWAS